jgi:hypothetical protein
MKLRSVGLAPWVMALGVGCLPQNPSVDDTAGTTVSAESGGSADSTGGDEGGGELLGCPAGGCTMLLAVQTLDDRIEVFVPDHPDAAYRGAISIDLKTNECANCGLGDNGEGRLDEPFGVARAGGFLHVLTGHYPTREAGSLVAFPLGFFDGATAGATVPVGDYFVGSQFQDGVVQRSLGEREAIFVHQHASGRLVVGVFNNDLFAGEDSWVLPGKLLVIDPADPGGEIGTVTLDGIGDAGCNGASQIVDLSGDGSVLAVACDGNEKVAMLDGSGVGSGTVADAAAGLGAGTLCSIPGATVNRRVRYLAPDGSGGFVVGDGPTATTLLESANLWHIGADCSSLGNVQLGDMGSPGDWQLGELVRLPASTPTWLFASGSSLGPDDGLRGIFVAHTGSGSLEVCPSPVAGFDEAGAWDDGQGEVIEPFALALTSDGAHLAVGAGPRPLITTASGVGYGKVLWASLSGPDPCSLSASVIDLTDGGSGHAAAPDPTDPSTFRRGPNVVVIQEIPG